MQRSGQWNLPVTGQSEVIYFLPIWGRIKMWRSFPCASLVSDGRYRWNVGHDVRITQIPLGLDRIVSVWAAEGMKPNLQ